MSVAVDYAQAGELKIGQVGIANLRVRTLDVERLAAEMRERVQRAPKLFSRAAVIVDFSPLPATPDTATARALIEALREAGVIPVALAYGSSDNQVLAEALGLPLLAKFRAQYEPVGAATAAKGSQSGNQQAEQEIAAVAAPTEPSRATAPEPGLMQATPCARASRSTPTTAT